MRTFCSEHGTPPLAIDLWNLGATFCAVLHGPTYVYATTTPGDVPPTPFIVPKFVRINVGAQWDERQSL